MLTLQRVAALEPLPVDAAAAAAWARLRVEVHEAGRRVNLNDLWIAAIASVSYTHLRAHETVLDLVCRLLLEKKKK